MTETPAATRLHPWNTDFTWTDRTGPFRTLTADQVEQFDAQGYVVVPSLLDGDDAGAGARRDRPLRGRGRRRSSRRVDGGRIAIAEAGAITFTTHLVARSDVLRAPQPASHDRRHLRRPGRSRRQPVLGPGRLQEAREAAALPVAPGQRLRVRRAPAVPDRVAGADRRHRSPTAARWWHRGSTGCGTIAHTYVDPLGWECLRDPDGAVARRGPRRRRGRVLVAHARTSPARTRPTTCARRTSSSTPRPGPRSSGATPTRARRPAGRPAMLPTASTRSWSAGPR